jgi:hypothetical protein
MSQAHKRGDEQSFIQDALNLIEFTALGQSKGEPEGILLQMWEGLPG